MKKFILKYFGTKPFTTAQFCEAVKKEIKEDYAYKSSIGLNCLIILTRLGITECVSSKPNMYTFRIKESKVVEVNK